MFPSRQSKRTNLKKPNSERTGHGLRVRFNPLALLLDASLEGEFDLVQRVIYEVSERSRRPGRPHLLGGRAHEGLVSSGGRP